MILYLACYSLLFCNDLVTVIKEVNFFMYADGTIHFTWKCYLVDENVSNELNKMNLLKIDETTCMMYNFPYTKKYIDPLRFQLNRRVITVSWCNVDEHLTCKIMLP